MFAFEVWQQLRSGDLPFDWVRVCPDRGINNTSRTLRGTDYRAKADPTDAHFSTHGCADLYFVQRCGLRGWEPKLVK